MMVTEKQARALDVAMALARIAESHGAEDALIVMLRPGTNDADTEVGAVLNGNPAKLLTAVIRMLMKKMPLSDVAAIMQTVAGAIRDGDGTQPERDGNAPLDYAICPAVKDMPTPTVRDSEKDACSSCGVPVWVSRSTREHAPNAHIVCLQCSVLLNAQLPDGKPC